MLSYSPLDCCLQYKRFYCSSMMSKFSFGFPLGHHNSSYVSLEYIQAISRLLSDFTQSVVSIHLTFNNLICLRQVWSNISSMRRSVSSPDETPRRKLKIRRAAEYFWRTSRSFIWWWNTVSNAWYYVSNKMILEGEIKDAKLRSFHLISKHSLYINFFCIFFMNY